MSKSLWERTVETTISVGERILAPIERFIGKRSLVGDATFFPLERFPWVQHIEENWEAIREEAERLLEDRDASGQLPGHLQGPDRDHRRRPLEDVLPLWLRLRGEAGRRDVPADGRT